MMQPRVLVIGAGAITVRLPAPAALPFVMDYVPGSGVDGVYFRPEGEGRLIAGLHTEEAIGASVDPDAPLRELADGVVERIAVQLMNRLRGAEELEPDRSWQGIYPMTPDHRPIVGAYPGVPGVICALGAGGSGIQLSPAIGRLAADVIRGGVPPSRSPTRGRPAEPPRRSSSGIGSTRAIRPRPRRSPAPSPGRPLPCLRGARRRRDPGFGAIAVARTGSKPLTRV